MAEKHLKNCSTFLVIREMQTKTSLRFHLTPIRMAKIKNSWNSRYWRGCEERVTILYCWWNCTWYNHSGSQFGVSSENWTQYCTQYIALPEEPAIPFLGVYPEYSPTCKNGICSTMFIEALFITDRSFQESRCPSTEEWIQKMWYIYKMQYYL